MNILIDTNMFLALKYTDVFEKLRKHGSLATLSPCIRELKKIARSKKKEAGYANIALALIKKKKIRIINTRGSADSALLNYAKRGYAVATNDRKLIKALKNNGIKVIRLRQKKYIIVM